MKSLKTIISTLVLATVITGCNSRIQQPLLQQDFISAGINNTQISSTIRLGKDEYKMDNFFPKPKQGMKWTYDYKRYHGVTGMEARIDISIEKVGFKEIIVSIDGWGNMPKLRFPKDGFWFEFNLYLTRTFHNHAFAEFPGSNIDDQYNVVRLCDVLNTTCEGYVEIPSGKYYVNKLLIQEYGLTNDEPGEDHNIFTWENSHFWVDEKVGLVEMKLETMGQPDLGVTTFTLVKTNIR